MNQASRRGTTQGASPSNSNPETMDECTNLIEKGVKRQRQFALDNKLVSAGFSALVYKGECRFELNQPGY